jgi:hypothetical protein
MISYRIDLIACIHEREISIELGTLRRITPKALRMQGKIAKIDDEPISEG